jgi:hypothetical protein
MDAQTQPIRQWMGIHKRKRTAAFGRLFLLAEMEGFEEGGPSKAEVKSMDVSSDNPKYC